MTDALLVMLNGRLAGQVFQRNARLRFVYDDAWRDAAGAYPLSLSMPLARREHPHAVIESFIWNLLPDNERTLERWAKQFHVSARNPFALIGCVGEDCAGAVQFVRPERRDAVLADDDRGIAWIDEAAVGRMLRSVLDDEGNGRTQGENGQFSLAGAQPKTSLLFSGDRWGVPSGRVPTTHILKPPRRDMAGHAENEHLCLRLAERLGMIAARSTVRRFDGELAIVVERYDRVRVSAEPTGFVRLHQEDMCQALGVLPGDKYENEGGPGAATIVATIRDHAWSPAARDRAAVEDQAMFVDSIIYNWLIGGTDAHAKNYSLLIGGRGTVRLAPLYDIASAYGFADIQPQKMKLAMKIEYYRVEQVLVRHWQRWAAAAGLDPDAVVARIAALAAALPEALAAVVADARAEGLDHAVIDRLEATLTERAQRIGTTI